MLLDPARCLKDLQPDFGKHVSDHGAIDGIDLQIAKAGPGIFFQRGQPLIDMFAVLPALAVLGMNKPGRILEAWHDDRNPALLFQRRDARPGALAQLTGLLTRFAQRHHARRAKADILPLTVGLHPQHLAARA